MQSLYNQIPHICEAGTMSRCLSDQEQQKVVKSYSDCQKRAFFTIFSALGKPFGEWKIPKQGNKDTACESN